jgi:hypothetical protein
MPRLPVLSVILALVSTTLVAQRFPPGYVDPEPELRAAEAAIGATALRCVTIAGTGYAGMVGQQRLAEKNVDWPRGEPLANYRRTMDWEQRSMREEFDRKPGMNPASWKWGVGWMGGTPRQQQPHQTFVVTGARAVS